MRVPTVRVKHPVLGFVTINASDFTDQHELHEEQAESFDAVHVRRAGATPLLDPALRDAASALCLRMVAFRRQTGGQPFADLPAVEQLAIIGELGAELDAAIVEYEQDQRHRAEAVSRKQERESQEAEVARSGQNAPSDEPELLAEPARVAKGPRGLWYVWSHDARISKGYHTEAEAQDALARGEG